MDETGDVDGDGLNDMAVSSYLDSSSTGMVEVFSGASSPSLTGTPLATLPGRAAGDYFGYSVSHGDVDGDGVRELVVGAVYDDDGGTDRGAVYVLLLNANGTVRSTVKTSDIAGNLTAALANSDGFGTSVAGPGDIDGDGTQNLEDQDEDGDGTPNTEDSDSDGDQVPDAEED